MSENTLNMKPMKICDFLSKPPLERTSFRKGMLFFSVSQSEASFNFPYQTSISKLKEGANALSSYLAFLGEYFLKFKVGP